MIRFPDNPKQVSLDFLKALDRDPKGTWLAQPKLDGWRRIVWRLNGEWTWSAKPAGSGALKPLPIELQAEFESLHWPLGIALDMEWTGNRCVEHSREHMLWVFDLLAGPQDLSDYPAMSWLGAKPFRDRYRALEDLMQAGRQSDRVRIVPCFPNPGLLDRFIEQTQDPLSEGLVVRRCDSRMIGALNRCETNPLWFKVKYRDVKGDPLC